MKKIILISTLLIVCLIVSVVNFLGVFVIQPIGMLPEGVTIVYWRTKTDLPFIASPDGILHERVGKVSLLGRGMVISKYADFLKNNEIHRFSYSKWLYLKSTDGREYN